MATRAADPETVPRPGPAALLLPFGCAIAALLVWSGGHDQTVFATLQSLTRPVADIVWAFVTDQAGLLSLAAWATVLLLWRADIATAILFSCPAGLVFVRGLKHLVSADRPQQLLAPDAIHVVGRELSSLSFPSGHTAAAFAAASACLYMLTNRLRRRVAVPVLIAAAAVGVSRIAVGAHWPVDVLAGAAIGWLVGLSGVLAARHWPLWQSRSGMLSLAMIGVGAGAARLLWDSGYASVSVFAQMLGAIAVAAALVSAHRTLKAAT